MIVDLEMLLTHLEDFALVHKVIFYSNWCDFVARIPEIVYQ